MLRPNNIYQTLTQHSWVDTYLAQLCCRQILGSTVQPIDRVALFLVDGACMFHFVALPTHAVFLEYFVGYCGKQSANLRLAECPVLGVNLPVKKSNKKVMFSYVDGDEYVFMDSSWSLCSKHAQLTSLKIAEIFLF